MSVKYYINGEEAPAAALVFFRVFLAVDTFWQLVRAEADRENKEQQQQQHEVSPVTKDMQLSPRAGIYKSAVAAWNRRRPAAAPPTAARSICPPPPPRTFLKSDRISTSFYCSISCWRSIKIHLAKKDELASLQIFFKLATCG